MHHNTAAIEVTASSLRTADFSHKIFLCICEFIFPFKNIFTSLRLPSPQPKEALYSKAFLYYLLYCLKSPLLKLLLWWKHNFQKDPFLNFFIFILERDCTSKQKGRQGEAVRERISSRLHAERGDPSRVRHLTH